MFGSVPSKLSRCASRTSHPSKLSPEVELHVEHSQKRLCCGVGLHHRAPSVHNLDQSLPCGRKQHAIFQLHLWISLHHGPANALPPIPTHLALFLVRHSVVFPLRNGRWMVAIESSSARPASGFEKRLAFVYHLGRVAVRCCLLPWSATACRCWVFSWCIVVGITLVCTLRIDGRSLCHRRHWNAD